MTRIFFFLIGFLLLISGITITILYLNILSYEYNFLEYVKFIIKRAECYLSIIGLIIINLTLFYKGGKKYGIYL